jgi:pimeloyl-ACP methyl ester carboxylesterase
LKIRSRHSSFGLFLRKRAGAKTLLISVSLVCGCHPLPAGDVAAVNGRVPSRRTGEVFLLRGWRDLYSAGIDDLAAELDRAGVNARVYRDAQWRDLAEALSRRDPSSPLILIGFSYGADDAIEIARRLQDAGESVNLLITIDPVTPSPVPANVRLCYDYFQTNGVWDIFPWLRGIPLKSDGVVKLINVDIRAQRPDLLEPDTAHSNIAANPKLHREIVRLVLTTWMPTTSQTRSAGDP